MNHAGCVCTAPHPHVILAHRSSGCGRIAESSRQVASHTARLWRTSTLPLCGLGPVGGPLGSTPPGTSSTGGTLLFGACPVHQGQPHRPPSCRSATFRRRTATRNAHCTRENHVVLQSSGYYGMLCTRTLFAVAPRVYSRVHRSGAGAWLGSEHIWWVEEVNQYMYHVRSGR